MTTTANNANLNAAGNAPRIPASRYSTIAKWLARLGVVLYPFAVTASALSVFGDLSWVIAFDVIICAAILYGAESRIVSVAVIVILHGAAFVMLPCIGTPITYRHNQQCNRNLKAIVNALHLYHDEHQRLPPAFLVDDQGRPQHSWRVLILPHLGYRQVYEAYRFDEPWNGPNNMKLAASVRITEYECPTTSSPKGTNSTRTSYLAVIGENAAWLGKEARTFAQIADGTSNSIAIIEADPIDHWMEPKDISADEAIQFLISDRSMHEHPSLNRLFGKPRPFPRNVALVDGSVPWMIASLPRDFVERLVTINDGLPVDPGDQRNFVGVDREAQWNFFLPMLFCAIVFVWPCVVWWLGRVASLGLKYR